MPSFKDCNDNTWELRITVSTVKRVRSMLDGVDLLSMVEKDSDFLPRLCTDAIFLVDLLYVILKPQLDAKDISDEQFGESLAGDAIEDAMEAVLEALVNFTPNPKDRAMLMKVVNATRDTMEKGRDMINAKLDLAIETETKRALDSCGKIFGNSLENSA